jgi:cold shock CspA family protein
MRYQGRITDWNDERGFGFITPNGGGPKVFLHVKAFGHGQPRPQGNELVTYELVREDKKGPRAEEVMFVGGRATAPRRAESRPPVTATIFTVLLLTGLGAYGWQHYFRTPLSRPSLPPTGAESARPFVSTPSFQCQGKTRCHQMTSCEEAKFYLRNCPGVQIDGDGDGIPCEDALCRN